MNNRLNVVKALAQTVSTVSLQTAAYAAVLVAAINVEQKIVSLIQK